MVSSGISRMKQRGKLSLEGLGAACEAHCEILAMPTFWSAQQHGLVLPNSSIISILT